MSADTLAADGMAVALPVSTLHSGGSAPLPLTEVGYVALPGQDEVVVLSFSHWTAALDGYTLGGAPLFETVPADLFGAISLSLTAASVFDVGSGDEFGITINGTYFGGTGSRYTLYNADGTVSGGGQVDPNYQTSPAVASDTPMGFHLEWVTEGSPPAFNRAPYAGAWADFSADGTNQGTSRSDPASTLISTPPYAATAVGGETLAVRSNEVMVDGAAVTTLPGEPPAAVTGIATAGLASGTAAAIAFTDSGTAYVTMFDAASNSFTPRLTLDWGGASDLHLLVLPDGGFAVSWMNGGAYKGELFDAAGNGGGTIALDGDVAGIDGHGDLYTVGLNAGGLYEVQTYAISGRASTVYTSDPSYTAPNGVTDIHLTGAYQAIHANNAGDTIWSDNSVNALYGGTGNDTFHMGRGGDWAAGGGGNDTFAFAGIPWQAGGILDFGAGDLLDLTGLMASTSDTGSDGFADGYLKITDDGSGNAEIWANYNLPGADGWLPVTPLYGVPPSSLQHVGDVISLGSSGGATDISTAAAHYTAPASVKTITLTGANQVIDASATSGVTITSNDSSNALYGGPGDDVFHFGRGGDWAQGGGGADTFVYPDIPWAGGGITDFNAAEGDKLDVSGLLAHTGFNGSDPFAAGYLKYTSDSSGNAQLWADYNQPGNDSWWLVTTLDGVSTSSLHYSGGMIT